MDCVFMYPEADHRPATLRKLEETIARCCEIGCPAVVITDMCGIPELKCPAEVITVHLIECYDTFDNDIWKQAVKLHSEHRDGPLILVDHRRFEFSYYELAAFLNAALNSEDLLISVRRMRDYPAQLNQYFNVVASMVMIRRDDSDIAMDIRQCLGGRKSLFVSRTFEWPWQKYLPGEPDIGLYRINFDANRYFFIPCDKVLKGSMYFWLESSQLARQVMIEKLDVSIVPMGVAMEQAPALIMEEDGTAQLWVRDSLTRLDSFQMTGLSRNALRSEKIFDHVQLQAEGRMLKIGEKKYRGPVTVFIPDDDVLLLNILEPARLPVADIEWPYVSSSRLWKVDAQSLVRHDPDNGQTFCQRQDMPEIFERDHCLIAIPAHVKHKLATVGWSNAPIPFVVSEQEELRVRTW